MESRHDTIPHKINNRNPEALGIFMPPLFLYLKNSTPTNNVKNPINTALTEIPVICKPDIEFKITNPIIIIFSHVFTLPPLFQRDSSTELHHKVFGEFYLHTNECKQAIPVNAIAIKQKTLASKISLFEKKPLSIEKAKTPSLYTNAAKMHCPKENR